VVIGLAVMALSCSPTTVEGSDELASADPAAEASPSPVTTATTALAIDTAATDRAAVERILQQLTLEEKVGQLLMPVLAGVQATDVGNAEAALNRQISGMDQPVDIVDAFNLGGVLYLEANVESAEQVREFSRDLQTVATDSNGLGLLVAVDQEGGRVNRITDQVTVFPAASDLAGDVDAVTEASYVTGQQLQRQGINVVLAPVADVVVPGRPGFIGDRSFGADPEIVAEMVSGSVNGLQQAGVAAAVKHWPGHGATGTDSHLRLPELDVDRTMWEERERPPFDAAIASDVAIVVVGHLAVPGLDDTGTPATLSEVIIDDLLRQEMGFDGVVMTDALNMGAVGQFDEGQIAVDAILAGADILLVPPDLAAAYESLIEAAESEVLGPDRLDESIGRILTLKQKLGLLPDLG